MALYLYLKFDCTVLTCILAILIYFLQGLGNKFLSHIREVDSILQVHPCSHLFSFL